MSLLCVILCMMVVVYADVVIDIVVLVVVDVMVLFNLVLPDVAVNKGCQGRSRCRSWC